MTHKPVMLGRDDLAELTRPHEGAVVTLLMTEVPAEAGRILLKNLGRTAGAVLEDHGMRSVEVAEMLAPVERVLTHHETWAAPRVSLSVLVRRGAWWSAPGPPLGEPGCFVGSRFQVKHLLDRTGEGRFSALALSRKRTMLYRGRAGSLEEVDGEHFPTSMEEVLRFADREPQLQLHGTGRQGGRAVAAFHGHGADPRAHEEDLLRFLRHVSAGVDAELEGEPLVLAATEEMSAAFRKVSDYRALLPDTVPGSGERHSLPELAEAAWSLTTVDEARRRDALRHAIEELSGQATTDLEETVAAAHDGRVEAILVAGDEVLPGEYDAAHRMIRDAGPGTDLLNVAACETWRHGGDVFVVPAADIPGDAGIAATLRY